MDSIDIVNANVHPSVLAFFKNLNEIEYSGDIKFDTLKPFAENPLIYNNTRKYYQRPEKIVWKSDDGYEHKIINVVRIDGREAPFYITTKFKIYQEKFMDYERKFKLTGSIEVPINKDDYDDNYDNDYLIDVSRIVKPYKKCLDITFWHLLVNNKYIFRVAFRKKINDHDVNDELDSTIECNIECETPWINRQDFTKIFCALEHYYVAQNDKFDSIEPWKTEDDNADAGYSILTSSLDLDSVKLVSSQEASDWDNSFGNVILDGNKHQILIIFFSIIS